MPKWGLGSRENGGVDGKGELDGKRVTWSREAERGCLEETAEPERVTPHDDRALRPLRSPSSEMLHPLHSTKAKRLVASIDGRVQLHTDLSTVVQGGGLKRT
jgi:hypothetical protein